MAAAPGERGGGQPGRDPPLRLQKALRGWPGWGTLPTPSQGSVWCGSVRLSSPVGKQSCFSNLTDPIRISTILSKYFRGEVAGCFLVRRLLLSAIHIPTYINIYINET